MTTSMTDRLLEVSSELSVIAQELGLPDLGESIQHDTRRRLEEHCVRAVVLGEIKQGKSSLINAVLGREALPTGVTPTTGAVVAVRVGNDPGAWLTPNDADAEREPLDADRFAKLATGREKPTSPATLELVVEDGALPGTLELIDTPGMNDMSRVRGAISRGELPRADALILVLDATQLLNRAEMAFLRDAVSAVGGLAGSGATLLLVINRIDLIEEADRPQLVEYLEKEITAVAPGAEESVEIFQTDARGALKRPSADTLGVAEVRRLRDRLLEIGKGFAEILPARARASLLRHTALLGHNAAIAARAITLEREILRREIRTIERDLVDNAADLIEVRKQIAADREKLEESSKARIDEFREEIEKSTRAAVLKANLRVLSNVLPGSLHDAFLAFAHEESEHLRAGLDEMTRLAIRTHGEQAKRRLFRATMRLGFRGPTIYIDPPSVVLEAGMVVIGVAGTAVMYFGSLVAGLTMTIAGPLATVFLREKSLRTAREKAQAELPAALDEATKALRDNIERVIDQHVKALDEHIVLANTAIGKQLLGVLERVRSQLGEDDGETADKRNEGRTRYHELELQLGTIRTTLDALAPH